MKPKSWVPPDGSCGVDDHLVPAMQPFVKLFAVHGVDYASRDMKVGINVKKMLVYLPMIMVLILIDVRGGYFDQTMMQMAVTKMLSVDLYKPIALQLATTAQMSFTEHTADQAYAIRVVLAHYREKFYGWSDSKSKKISKATPQELVDSFSCMGSSMAVCTKKDKKRTSVFLAYQESSSESEGDVSEEDSVTVVLQYFDIADRTAQRRYSNGDLVAAATYTHGTDGFVVAEFAKYRDVAAGAFPLLILNSLCVDGKIITPKPPVKPRSLVNPKSKAKAKAKENKKAKAKARGKGKSKVRPVKASPAAADEDEEGEEEELEDEDEEDKSTVEVAAKPEEKSTEEVAAKPEEKLAVEDTEGGKRKYTAMKVMKVMKVMKLMKVMKVMKTEPKRSAPNPRPTGDLSEIVQVLPERCRPGDGYTNSKSYIVPSGDDLKLKVQVLLSKRAFYIWDVDSSVVPRSLKLNKFGCLQIGWKNSIEAAWELTVKVAGHSV